MFHLKEREKEGGKEEREINKDGREGERGCGPLQEAPGAACWPGPGEAVVESG